MNKQDKRITPATVPAPQPKPNTVAALIDPATRQALLRLARKS